MQSDHYLQSLLFMVSPPSVQAALTRDSTAWSKRGKRCVNHERVTKFWPSCSSCSRESPWCRGDACSLHCLKPQKYRKQSFLEHSISSASHFLPVSCAEFCHGTTHRSGVSKNQGSPTPLIWKKSPREPPGSLYVLSLPQKSTVSLAFEHIRGDHLGMA